MCASKIDKIITPPLSKVSILCQQMGTYFLPDLFFSFRTRLKLNLKPVANSNPFVPYSNNAVNMPRGAQTVWNSFSLILKPR